MQKIYACNICHERLPPSQLFGLMFSDMHKFRVVAAEDTDGQHICEQCIDQLQRPIPPTGSSLLEEKS